MQFLGIWKDPDDKSKGMGIVLERLRTDLCTFLIVDNAAKRNIASLLEFKQAVLVDVTLALRCVIILLCHLVLNNGYNLLTHFSCSTVRNVACYL